MWCLGVDILHCAAVVWCKLIITYKLLQVLCDIRKGCVIYYDIWDVWALFTRRYVCYSYDNLLEHISC